MQQVHCLKSQLCHHLLTSAQSSVH
jgi:hypothetical protein